MFAGRYPRDIPGSHCNHDEARLEPGDSLLRDGVDEGTVPRQGQRQQACAQGHHWSVRRGGGRGFRVRKHAVGRYQDSHAGQSAASTQFPIG